MLDLFGIVVSTVMILLIIFRAIQLNAKLPWFEQIQPVQDDQTQPRRRGPPPPPWSRATHR